MSVKRDSLIIENIKQFRLFEKKADEMRVCYQFLQNKPDKAKGYISQIGGGNGAFCYAGAPGEDFDEETLATDLKAMDTLYFLQEPLKFERKAWTVKNMRAIIPKLLLKMEHAKRQAEGKIALEICKELKPYEHPGFDIGFVRNVLEKETPFTGKAEDVIEAVINNTLKELLGLKEDVYFQIDYSAIIDYEDIEEKVSPVVREFLECNTSTEALDFIDDHQKLLEVKYQRVLNEQCFRYYFKGMDQKAKAVSFLAFILQYAYMLKEFTFEYFSEEDVSPWSEDAQALYNGVLARGPEIKRKYISNFQYQFKTIPSYEFVTVVPNETEKNYPLFMLLKETLRTALTEGKFSAVDEALRGMSIDGRKKSLSVCATGGFFYFKRTISHRDFGVMHNAVKKAIEKLA